MDSNSEYLKQFQGSASANLVFVILFLIGSAIKKLCERNSRCHAKCHSCCITLDIDDRTLRENPMSEA